MPRRKKNNPNILIILGTIFVLFLFSKLFDALNNEIWPVLFVIAMAIAGFVFLRIVIPMQRRNKVLGHVDSVTDTHIDALIRQQTILIRSDAYGKPIIDKWQTEVKYFIAQHVRPSLPPTLCPLLDKDQLGAIQRIMQRVASASQNRPALATLPTNMTPAGFEAYCAESLRGCGWAVALTPLCRDQGVDVIAEKNGVRVVLQCKLYSNPVGNKAVQEIAAGKLHQQAHCAAVVTNYTYTESAKQLAATNGIWLLHHTDLPKLEQLLRMTVLQ